MKNILLLYKKLYKENKTIVLLYLLLLIMSTVTILFVLFEDSTRYINDIQDKEWKYSHLLDDIWYAMLSITSISLVISIHWGIRHFNYSSQSYYHNTLPISVSQKFVFIFTYALLLLPVLHCFLFGGLLIAISDIEVAMAFNKTSLGFFADVIKNLNEDYGKWFFLIHMPIFIAFFVLVALFFNKMGFIKTVVASFVIMIIGILQYGYMNNKLWEKRGDFGTAQSAIRFPDLYLAHYISITVLFVAVLYIVYTRLTDKNY